MANVDGLRQTLVEIRDLAAKAGGAGPIRDGVMSEIYWHADTALAVFPPEDDETPERNSREGTVG